ncbi:1-deoxy-D-xylulose-5-phosphate reductoisomerase [Candidatus Pelagibacter bacterium]|nr:1-deoxy-D-xylulose-5-phosphate reductoisomerase [Candidatus Pelagibacter bacterium]
MKKKIAILGSTGSIGKTLVEIIKKEKKFFDIVLLTANKNYKKILKQAKFFKVKNLIITDQKSYLKLKKRKIKNIKIYNNYDSFNKIFKKRIDYVMSAISGIYGLDPTIKIIRHTKKIAIANKESIICGWNLINKELKKNKTEFIPVDSEHFSLWYGLQNSKIKNVEYFYLTASGGPLYKTSLKKFKNISTYEALKHPNWKMGKKISIDSATMINKVYEVIEAKNIFNIPYKKIKILTHPRSYVHAILKFNTGLIKIVVHDTTMKIPIFNTLFVADNKKLNSKKIDLNILNNLDLKEVDPRRYPMIRLLKYLPKNHTLFETVVVSANDALVELFLKEKIRFTDIQKKLFNFIKSKEFIKYKKSFPQKLNDIIELNNYVRLKIYKKVYKSPNG